MAESLAKQIQETSPYNVGVCIAVAYDWQMIPILECFQGALEDSNMHEEYAIVQKWIDRYNGTDLTLTE